jgi:hypothetical protein
MARGPEPGDSVYDFLYVDARRIAVFLSQFNQYGHLTSLTRAVSETSSTSGGVNVVAAKLDTGASEQTSQTRQFDPQWLAPLSFLDQANERGMIVRDLVQARIGQLVLVSGRLAMFDLGVMRDAWNIKAIKDALLQQASNEALASPDAQQPRPSSRERQRLQRERKANAEKDMEIGFEMVKLLPHAIQCSVRAEENEVWSSLRDDNLIIPASEILIKHGHVVAGDWNIVGILDALPDEAVPTIENNPEQFVTNAMAAISLGALWQFIATLAPIARTALGRPASSFGMTPLLIFREVAA